MQNTHKRMGQLTSMHVMLSKAQRNRYAIGAFNFTDLVDVQAALLAAEQERTPLVLQIHPAGIDLLGLPYAAGMVKIAAEHARVPLALHLDHSQQLGPIEDCIEAGFCSVMIDGSKLPLAANIELTREAVKMAHKAGVYVEAELGRVASGAEIIPESENEKYLTDPCEAQEFIDKTGADALAIAIGSAHGFYRVQHPDLDFGRLRQIRKLIQAPLVLHGGSGLPECQIRRAIELGITKINVHTDLIEAYSTAQRALVTTTSDLVWSSQVLEHGRRAIAEAVKAKLRLFGGSGQSGCGLDSRHQSGTMGTYSDGSRHHD